jgi:hypothetical protein
LINIEIILNMGDKLSPRCAGLDRARGLLS